MGKQRICFYTSLEQKSGIAASTKITTGVPGKGLDCNKKPQSDPGAVKEFFSGIRALLQQNVVLVPHATACLRELQALLERLNASTTDFLNVAGPFVRNKEALGCILKRLCPCFGNPLQEKRRLANSKVRV